MDTVEDWEQLRKSQRHLNIYRYKESIQFSRSRKTYRCSIDDCHHDYGRSPYLAADIINHFEARHPVVFQSSDPDDWTSVQTKVKRIAKHASFVEKSDSILRKRCRLCLYNYGKIDLTHQCSQIEAHMVHAHAEDWYPENKTETRDWIPVEELNKLETKRGPQSKYAQWLERHKETEILRCSLSKCHEEFGTSVRSAGHILQTHFRTVHPIEFAKLEEIDIWTSGSLEFSTHMREFKGYLQFNQSHTKFRCNVNRCFKQFGSYQTSKHAFEVHMQSKHSTEYEEMIERNKVLQVENRYIRHKETEIFKVGHLIKYNSNCAAHYCVVNNCNEKIEAKGTALCGVFHYHVKTIHPIEYEANRQYFDSIDKDTLYYGQQSIAKQMGELATWIYKRTRAYRYYTRTHRVFQSGKKVVKKPLIAVKLGRISYRSFGRSLSSHNVENVSQRDTTRESIKLTMPKRKRVPSPANSSKNEVKQIRIKNEHELDTSPNTSSYRSSTTVKDEKPTLQPKLEDSVDEISTEELSDEETDVEDFSDVHFADHKREDVSDESVDLNFMDEFSKSNLLFAQLVERYGEGWDEFTTYPWLFTFADRLSREMAELVGKFPPKLRASLYYFVSRQTRKEVQDVGQFREQLIKRLYFRLMWKWNDDHFGNVEMMYSDDSAWLANEEPIEETDETTQTREGRIQIQVESVVRQCFFSCRVVVMKVPQTGYQVKLLNNRLVTYYRIFFIFNRLYNSTIPILVGTLHYHDVIFYVSNQGIRERNVWNANVTAVALVCKLLNLTLCDLNILLENDVVMAGHVKMFLTDDPTQTFFPSIPTIRQTFPEQLLRISSIKPDTKMKFVLSVENGSLLTELAPLLEEDDRLRGKFVMLSTRGTPSSTDFWMLSRFRLAYPLAKFLHLGDLNIGGLHIYCFMKFGFTSPNPTPNLCFYKQHFFTFYKTEPFGSNIDLLAIDPELATRADCANVYKNRITKSYSQKRVSTLSGVIDVMQTRDPEFHKKLVAYENRKEGNRYFFLEIQMIPNYARFVHDQLIQRLIS